MKRTFYKPPMHTPVKEPTVHEGLRRIQLFWPGVMFQMTRAERLDVMQQRLRELSTGASPSSMKELIGRMDFVGLAIRGAKIVLAE